MDKPITVKRFDFTNDIVELCNSSNLPAFVKAEVLETIVEKLRSIIDEEYQRDSENYLTQLKQEEAMRNEIEKRDEMQNGNKEEVTTEFVPYTGGVSFGG